MISLNALVLILIGVILGVILGWLLHRAFAKAANESKTQNLLAASEQRLAETSKSSIESALEPFRVQVENLTKDVRDSSRSQIDLKGQLLQMNKSQQHISKQAENLTSALRGEPQARGKWGEMQLERTLESSGLRKDMEYRLQPSYRDSDSGERYRPDVEIMLPDRHVVFVDAKTSLIDYERYTSNENAEQREEALQGFLRNMRLRIKELSEKDYSQLGHAKNFDYVLMFVPIESAFSLALEQDKTLMDYGMEKKIVIVSPSTLMLSLRTIYHAWRADKQNKNTEKIAQEGGKLYDKVVNFLEDMRKHGEQLQTAHKSYDGAMNKLSEGHGSILSRTKKLEELGVKSTKSLKYESSDEE